MKDNVVDTLRETDRWLRRVAIIMPMITFIAGVIVGLMTVKVIEHRLAVLEVSFKETKNEVDFIRIREERILAFLNSEHKMHLE